MEHIAHIMEYYKEALDELMGAQEYVRRWRAENDGETKAMYKEMARQELMHEQLLEKAAEHLASQDREGYLREIWKHLKVHLHRWYTDLTQETAET